MSLEEEKVRLIPESRIHYVRVIEKNGEIEVKPVIDLKKYVYDFLKKHGPTTREILSKATSIPRTTLYDVLDKLILANKVRKLIEREKRKGRPRVYYEAI
ncbi:MAG: helix-turn-helix domain-containing protein [Candidatus Odinarchaeia archaeon]